MTLPPQKNHINNIFSQNPKQNSSPSYNIFNRENKSTVSPMNIFQKIRLGSTSVNNPYKTPDQTTSNLFAKKLSQSQEKQPLKNQNSPSNNPSIQVKIMYDDRKKQNAFQKEEILKKQQRVKKIKEEEQIKKKSKLLQLQLKSKQSNTREENNVINNKVQIPSSLIKSQSISNNQNNISEFEAALRQIKQPYWEQKKQSQQGHTLENKNQLQTIHQQSIQQSAIKPRNLISSTHSHDSRLQYFDNISQSEQQSNQKPKSNTLKNQQDQNQRLHKQQFKMTDSLRLMNQIKQTNSYGVMSKTSNSLRSQIIKPKQQIAYELQTKKVESQSQSSDHHSELNSSRILQKKQIKDGQELTKSQKMQNKKIELNQNLTTKTHHIKQTKQQNVRGKDYVHEFEVVQQKQIKQASIINEKGQEKRKASGSSQQQMQVPKKLQSNISFGPQSFLNERQKPNLSQQKKDQIKKEVILTSNQNVQKLWNKPVQTKEYNTNNISNGNIFQRRIQPLKNNIFNIKSQPYKKHEQISKVNNSFKNKNQIQTLNLVSQQKQEIQQLEKQAQNLPCFNIKKLSEQQQQEKQEEENLPCFNIQKNQEKKEDLDVPSFNTNLLKIEEHKITQINNNPILIRQNKPILSNTNGLHMQKAFFSESKARQKQQMSIQKQKNSIAFELKKDQQNSVSNYYVQKNCNYMVRIMEICQRKRQILKKIVNFKVLKPFQDQFIIFSKNVFANQHNLYFLLNLSQKLQSIGLKVTKKEILQEKTKNYMNQLLILNKSLQKISLVICQQNPNKNKSFLGQNKYMSKHKPVSSQKIKQFIQKTLLKYRLLIRQKQIYLKNIQKQGTIQILQSNNNDSDESQEDNIFINDFSFGCKKKNIQNLNEKTFIKDPNKKIKMYSEKQLKNFQSNIQNSNKIKKKQTNKNSKQLIFLKRQKNASFNYLKINRRAKNQKYSSSSILSIKKIKPKVFLLTNKQNSKSKDQKYKKIYNKIYHHSLEEKSSQRKFQTFIETYQNEFEKIATQPNQIQIYVQDKWEIELSQDVQEQQ